MELFRKSIRGTHKTITNESVKKQKTKTSTYWVVNSGCHRKLVSF